MTHNARRILSLLSRRKRQPEHLQYRKRMGAVVIDREAFERAWHSAMPVDTFTSKGSTP